VAGIDYVRVFTIYDFHPANHISIARQVAAASDNSQRQFA
jgi:hypothetical protein